MLSVRAETSQGTCAPSVWSTTSCRTLWKTCSTGAPGLRSWSARARAYVRHCSAPAASAVLMGTAAPGAAASAMRPPWGAVTGAKRRSGGGLSPAFCAFGSDSRLASRTMMLAAGLRLKTSFWSQSKVTAAFFCAASLLGFAGKSAGSRRFSPWCTMPHPAKYMRITASGSTPLRKASTPALSSLREVSCSKDVRNPTSASAPSTARASSATHGNWPLA
mmetsp:Transcript_21573/g.54987  ORF Transcript_21573/g.54987 Transcript_21573/m.54987 type:complete len:219 (+) Transcript_21573:178-834(+)